MEFSNEGDASYSRLDCWSKNGQNVYLDLSFYMVLNKEKLYNFYMEFGGGWRSIFLQIAIATIKDKANQYNTTAFFTNRAEIKAAFHQVVNTTFFSQSGGALIVPQFQLRRVGTDTSFEEAVEAKVVAKQNTTKFQEIQNLETLRKNITQIQENATNQIRNYNVNKTKEAKIIEANATVTAQKIVLQDEVALYLNFDSGLSLNSDQKSLLELIYVDTIRALTSSKTQFVFGVTPTASIV